jgi:hypothetical protein
MHRSLLLTFLLLTATMGTLFSAPRQWTNLRGDTITAALEGVRDGTAILRTRGGRELEYPTYALSKQDQEYIKVWSPLLRHEITAGLLGSLWQYHDGTDSLVTYHTPPEEAPDIVGLFFSTGLSPYGREFMPVLVDYYEDTKREYPNFELIFVSTDPDADTMQSYVKEYEVPFPVLSYNVARNLPAELRRLRGRGVPNLVLVGPDGEKIADSFRGDDYIGPEPVLDALTTLLEYGVPIGEEESAPTATETPESQAPAGASGGVTIAPAPPMAEDTASANAAADTATDDATADTEESGTTTSGFGSPGTSDAGTEEEAEDSPASNNPFAVPAATDDGDAEVDEEDDSSSENPFGF